MTRNLRWWLVGIGLSLGGFTFGTDPAPSQAGFDRLKSMQGDWSAKSTQGWEQVAEFRTIAGGTTVLEVSKGAHPGQEMATAFYLDGGELWLQHYCVAKNAPRMKATRIDRSGKQIWFTFVDGANLADRNQGHMDSAYYEFRDDGSVITKWTWYEDGKEQWAEEIVMVRAKS